MDIDYFCVERHVLVKLIIFNVSLRNNTNVMFNLLDIMYTTVYVISIFFLINFLIYVIRPLYFIVKNYKFKITINNLISIIKYLYTIVKNYKLSTSSFCIKVQPFIDLINGYDIFILTNSSTNKTKFEYKFMLEASLHLLNEVYHKFSDQQFTFLLVFTEVDNNTGLHSLVANPFTFNYNVNNPISTNELFSLVRFNKLAFIKNNKNIVLTIRKI
jgi:hypothetical protein